MTTHAPAGEIRRPHRRGFRLTSRVFWDMAIYMVGLGLIMGLIFPPFVVLLGVPETFAYRSVFRLACLMAGFMVGAMNYALVKGVVGGRMEVLGGHLESATTSITSATSSGDWSAAVFERIAVDSDDQIGEAGRAFNSLLGAVEGRKDLEERLRYQAYHDMLTGLPNRAFFMDKLAEAEALRQEERHTVGGALPRRGQPEGGQRQPRPRGRRHPHQAALRAVGGQRARHRHGRPPLRRRVRDPADGAGQLAPGRARGAPRHRLPPHAHPHR